MCGSQIIEHVHYQINVQLKINTADSLFSLLMIKIQSVSLDHNDGCLILCEDKFIFSRTITSKIFGKQRTAAVHTS